MATVAELLAARDGKHYKYGGSTIELTEICPGSATERQAIGDAPAGAAADRGTRIHLYSELIWTQQKLPDDARSDEISIAQACVAAIYDTAAELGFSHHEVLVEQELSLAYINLDAGGSADQVAYKVFGDLFVGDIKAGRNFVNADGLLQLAFYAVGAMAKLDAFDRQTINNVHMVIFQPEQEAPYTVRVQKWTISASELAIYEDRIIDAITVAESNPDLKKPGEHCEKKYCPARATCSQYKTWLNMESGGMLQRLLDNEAAAPLPLPLGAELAKVLKMKSFVVGWFTSAEEHAKSLLKASPDAVPGYTLKDSYSHRGWTNTKLLDAKAKEWGLKADDYKPREPITPAAFERLLKSKKVEGATIDDLTSIQLIGVNLKPTKEDQQSLGEKVFDLINA